MVIDKIERLKEYEAILPSLKDYEKYLYKECEEMNAFYSDSKRSTLIIVKEGSLKIATTWREVKQSRDIIGAVLLKKDEFALFLPGEKYLTKECKKAIKYVLE